MSRDGYAVDEWLVNMRDLVIHFFRIPDDIVWNVPSGSTVGAQSVFVNILRTDLTRCI